MSGGSQKVGTRAAHFHAAQVLKTKAHAAFSRVTAKVHHIRTHRGRLKHSKEFASLQELVEEALEDARRRAEEQFSEQRYEVTRTVDAVKQQLKNLLDSLPPEYAELDGFAALLKKLQKSGERDDKSSFARGSGLVGQVRTEVQMGEVKRWVGKVDTKVGAISPDVALVGIAVERDNGEGGGGGEGGGAGGNSQERSAQQAETDAAVAAAADAKRSTETPSVGAADRLSFHTVCDDVRRKKRRGEPVEPKDVELVADRAFVLIRELRNELSPSWKPEEVPRWLNAGDKYVFDLALATVPKELFEATNGYDGIQNLRKQQQVFTLRAADQVSAAAKRT